MTRIVYIRQEIRKMTYIYYSQKVQKSKIIPFLNRYFLTKWQVGARGTGALGYTVCCRCPVQSGKSQVQLLWYVNSFIEPVVLPTVAYPNVRSK